MGEILLTSYHFTLLKENIPDAMSSFRSELYQGSGYINADGEGKEIDLPEEYIEVLKKMQHPSEVFACWGYELLDEQDCYRRVEESPVLYLPQGNITGIVYTGKVVPPFVLHDPLPFCLMAPFIERGSYLQFHIEDETDIRKMTFRLAFDGKRCIRVEPDLRYVWLEF